METNHKIDRENDVFNRAADLVEYTNKFVYLTGKAGTGKTTFLTHIKNTTKKKTVVLAPTGIAAMNCGGVTIHSFFQLPLIPIAPYDYNIDNPTWEDRRAAIPDTINYSHKKKKLIRSIELLIIEEVSMVRADTLDVIDTILRSVRNNPKVKFGGVQVILIGDAFQLPPVCEDNQWEFLRQFYESAYFFSSIVIENNPPLYIELKRIYRQKDEDFIKLLDRIRKNNLTPNDTKALNLKREQSIGIEENNYITITTHNETVNQINSHELEKICSREFKFEAKISGTFSDPKLITPTDRRLFLKVGARVIFVKNDVGNTRRFYNGKTGVVKEITEDKINVYCDDGKTVTVEKVKWEDYDYSIDNDNNLIQYVVGQFEQFPLRLAWAVTVHKSQGLTFEKINVDIENSFENGQVYVAFSRCPSLHGINLLSPVTEEAIKTAPAVLEFAKNEASIETITAKFDFTTKKSPILPELLTFEAFKKHVKRFEDEPEKIMVPSEQEFRKNRFCTKAVEISKQLSYLCGKGFNGSVNMKTRHTNFIISYLIKNDLLCHYTISRLHSVNNPDYEVSVGKSMKQVEKGIILKNKYINALQEVRSYRDISNAINQQFREDLEKYKNDGDNNITYPDEIFEEYINSRVNTNTSEANPPVSTSHKPDLNNQGERWNKSSAISKEELKRFWLIKNEIDLSLANLKELSKLIVKTYKKCFRSEIDTLKRDQKNRKDRKNKKQKYDVRKMYSKAEKLRVVKSHPEKEVAELASILKCSERNIRILKKQITIEAMEEKNLAKNFK